MKKLGFVFLVLSVLFLVSCKENKTLPNLTNSMNKEAIISEFEKTDLIVTFDFKEIYTNARASGFFYKYEEGFVPGNTVEDGTVITIYMTSDAVRLPDLEGKTREEMLLVFSELGVSEEFISFTPDINTIKKPGAFIGYRDSKVGDLVKPADGKIRIYYNIAVGLPDLSGQNKNEIILTLKELSLERLEFSYQVDNSKEIDTFSHYFDKSIGDSAEGNQTIKIVLYSNDDINNEKQLFISKYIEYSDAQKGIELYNPTDQEIDLSEYYLAILNSGEIRESVSINLSGTLLTKEAFVIINTNANSDLKAKADLLTNLPFDGNDVIQLRKVINNTYIDTIYDIGNISTLMDEEIFIRRANITHGRRDFNILEWAGFIPTYYENIGVHPVAIPESPVFSLITDKTFQEYGMTKVKLVDARVIDGDTVYLESVDSRDQTSYTGSSRIRMLLVDTPETEKPGVVGQPYAQKAKNHLSDLLERAVEIYIQSDKSAGLTENYGRHLGLIWANIGTISNPNWVLTNFDLLKNGLGEKNIAKTSKYMDAPIFGNRYLYQWGEDALNYAKSNKLGIFSEVHED